MKPMLRLYSVPWEFDQEDDEEDEDGNQLFED